MPGGASGRPKVGLALGAGGARGWCHIGVIRELQDMGVEVDAVSGASMGAVVGAVHAGGRLDALEGWALSLTRQKFLRLLDLRPGSGGLIEGGEILNVLKSLEMPERFEDLPRSLTVVASDMATGREVWLREGSVAHAVRASAALPGVLSPHRIGGRWFLDGGLTNPVPVAPCRAMGADVVIAVNPNAMLAGQTWKEEPRPAWLPGLASWWERLSMTFDGLLGEAGAAPAKESEPRPGYFEVVTVALDVMQEQIVRSRLAGDPPHVLLNAQLAHRMTVLEFDRAAEAIEDGRRMVRQQADLIRQVTGVEGR